MHSKPLPAATALDWDDLRYVLAVARAGTLSGAARALSVTHSTVLRRVDAIEARLQVRLFERQRSGYTPTAAGEALRHSAEQCEPLVAEAERRVIGQDSALHGHLRLTTLPMIAHDLLPGVLAEFCAAYPHIELELGVSLDRVDLSHRAADVALRMSAQVPEHLVGRQLGMVRYRIYGWRGTSILYPPFDDGRLHPVQNLAQELPWIGFERDVFERPSNRWLDANVPASQVKIRVDHFPSTLALLRTGIGVGMLPELMARGEPALVALSEPIEAMTIPLWILTHPDLRNTARVRAFMRMAGDRLAALLGAAGGPH
jgi:DNA-binding transcriptional LysR family regulator